MQPILYFVVPCFNEEEVLNETSKCLTSLLKELISSHVVAETSRICYVDDGSVDETWHIIEHFCSENHYVMGIKLSRNCGHQNALMAGLSTIVDKADIIITIDADLQDDIHVIPSMISKYEEGCDIVYGVRGDRATDSLFKRTTAQTFYRLMKWMGVDTVYNHADFRLMSRRTVKRLLEYPEKNLFLRGIVPLIGFRHDVVKYGRLKRKAGETKYPLRKMLEFAVNGITSFSVKPLRLMIMLGAIMLLFSMLMFIYVICSLICHKAVAGWASIMLSVWLVGGMVVTCLGVVGEYIGKTYIEVKNRPLFHVEEVIG